MSENLFDNYDEMNRWTYATEIRKVKSRLLTVALILLASDILGLLVADMLTFQLFLWSLIVPAIIASLAFLALKEPMSAMIIATVIIAALWIYVVVLTGARGAISGFLVKIVVIYIMVAGFKSALAAQKAKKEIVS